MNIKISKTYVDVQLQGYSGRYLVIGKESRDYGELDLIIESETGEVSKIDYEFTMEVGDDN